MCAINYMSDLISPPTREPSPRQPTPQPPKPAKPTGQEQVENTNGVRLTQNGAAPGPSGPETPRSARKKAQLDDEPDALQQVPVLCKRLAMVPPQFQTTPVGPPSPSSPPSLFLPPSHAKIALI